MGSGEASTRPIPLSFVSITPVPSSRPYELRAWNRLCHRWEGSFMIDQG